MACISFQSQLSSILEVLVKAAVSEISKLVDDNSAFLHLEISQKQSENEALKRKVIMMENKNAQLQRAFANMMHRGSNVGNDPHSTGQIKCPVMEDATISFTIKEESPDEVLWISDRSGTGAAQQYQNAAESQRFEEASGKTTSDFGDSFISSEQVGEVGGLQLLVKTEKADGECHLGAGKQDQLPDLALDERESQLWSSIIEGSDIDSSFPDFSSVVDEYSNSFPEQSNVRVVSGKSAAVQQHSSQRSCNGVYNSDYHKDPQLSGCQARPSSAVSQTDTHKDPVYLPRNNSHGLLRRGQDGEHTAVDALTATPSHNTFTAPAGHHLDPTHRPFTGGGRSFVCSQCGKAFARLHQFKLHQQSHKRKRAFWCTVCGKGFQCSSHLSIHHRTHTGEKPYCCLQCGKRFTQQSSLRVHQRTHSGERPYNCAECGKTFILMHHLKRHCVIHTYS
ncbi:zinc finger protein 8-like isoform X2 [Dunckerocampus dactyliophorus]|uniref:zinc finger protein 8-like isoform X2 n=1 Tax=Dunckerocampus dactyliophorus TaxID=161453 RepID=UPI0024049EBC|nr:zinc finger protein 8-like isoform X2 [Dunckerocampus dactyliophorus]